MQYSQLSPDHIAKHVERLECRIRARFPTRGLTRVGAELNQIAKAHMEASRYLVRPRPLIRFFVILIAIGGIMGLTWLIWEKWRRFGLSPDEFNSFEGVEAAVNLILLVSAGLYFLMNLETRAQRSSVLKRLHDFRSIAHVIDMCQLSKAPHTSDNTQTAQQQTSENIPGSHSDIMATHELTPTELTHYLHFCSEMLSLIGKLAALYMQNMRDPVVIQAVNEIEELTSQISRIIWQKIQLCNLSKP